MQLVDIWSTLPRPNSFTQADRNGANVAKVEFLKALVRHAPVSQILLYVPLTVTLESVRQSEEWRCFTESLPPNRVELVQFHDLLERGWKEPLIVYNHGANNYLFQQLRSLKQCKRFPVFSILHSLDYGQLFRDYLWLLRTTTSFDRIIIGSDIGRSVIRRIANTLNELGSSGSDSVIKTIPLGIDPDEFAPRDRLGARAQADIRQDRVVFLYFGRITASEKADLRPLLLGLRALRAAGIACELIIAGHDNRDRYSEELKSIAAELGIIAYLRIETNVTRERKRVLFEVADVFVALAENLQETFGLSILEAMASELPIICSDWSGYRELVLHGKTGLHVKTSLFAEAFNEAATAASDLPSIARRYSFARTCVINPAELVKYMLLLALNSELRHQYGNAGRQRVLDNFSWPSIVRMHECEWYEAISVCTSESAHYRPSVPTVDWLSFFGCYATQLCNEDQCLELQDESICNLDDMRILLNPRNVDGLQHDYGTIVHLFIERPRSIRQVVNILGEGAKPQILNLIKAGLLVIRNGVC